MDCLDVSLSRGSSKPQRLASCSESGVVASVPQMPQFEATSSLGGLVADH